jgi:ubiquinone/menaquinone biosynthesis C-methylase UbiE
MALLVGLFERLSVRKRRPDFPVLRELLAAGPESRILDLGGGGGSATNAYAAGLRHVTVLEPDPKKIAYGRRRHPHLAFAEGQAERIPFPDGSFDRIVAIVSFHHVDDPARSLAEIRRVLTPHGRLVLFELRPAQHAGPLAHLLGRRLHGSAPHFYEPEHLMRLLEANGLRDVAVRDGEGGYFVAARS